MSSKDDRGPAGDRQTSEGGTRVDGLKEDRGQLVSITQVPSLECRGLGSKRYGSS